jgi:hypothetical protein
MCPYYGVHILKLINLWTRSLRKFDLCLAEARRTAVCFVLPGTAEELIVHFKRTMILITELCVPLLCDDDMHLCDNAPIWYLSDSACLPIHF